VKFSQGAQPPFSTIPELLEPQSPERSGGRPADRSADRSGEGPPPAGPTPGGGDARDGSSGPSAVASEGGSRVGPESTLSTPFGALSRGSGATPGFAEGFPPSEDGGAAGAPSAVERPPVAMKDPAPNAPGGGGGGAPPARFVAPGVAPVEKTSDEGGAGVVSDPPAEEGKVDEQPRWVADPQTAAKGSPFPSSAGEAARKVDADSALDGDDGWSEDDWGVDDDADDDGVDGAGGDKEGEGNTTGTAAAAAAAAAAAGTAVGEHGVAGAGEGGDGSGRGGEDETNLFPGEASEGGGSWTGRGGESGSGRSEEESESGSVSGSGSDVDSFSDNDLSNEASIAETTASDFFAVRVECCCSAVAVVTHRVAKSPRH